MNGHYISGPADTRTPQVMAFPCPDKHLRVFCHGFGLSSGCHEHLCCTRTFIPLG